MEIRNTSGAPVDLDGWIFDDDDDAHFAAGNISAADGNTIVPAGGVAVLYAAADLDFMPERFLNAWGSGLTLIPVNNFTALTPTDAIGLWSNKNDYDADTTGTTVSPRRTFNNTVASINYNTGFPSAASGRSIVWKGAGNITSGTSWAQSQVGLYNSFVSSQTSIASAQVNSTDDLGNPGSLPAGEATPGLRISEIMFAPKSPLVTVGYAEEDFEWIELFNNTATDINFGATGYVLDDAAGGQIADPNITEGILAAGGAGILFNSQTITTTDMQTIWGSGLNFIPVANWPNLNNGLETVALWDSEDDYNADQDTGSGRIFDHAAAVVNYNTVAGQGWPTSNNESSFYLKNLSDDPNLPASWARSAVDDAIGSRRAVAIFRTAVDHPGGDVGSPGIAPAIATTGQAGDYNQNGTVDAADYVVWRDNVNTSATLPNDTTPGAVTDADYQVWRMNFGNSAGSGGGITSTSVPEPTSAVIMLLGCAGLWIKRRVAGVERQRAPRSCSHWGLGGASTPGAPAAQ